MQTFCADMSCGLVVRKNLFRRMPSPLFRLFVNVKDATDNSVDKFREARDGEKVLEKHEAFLKALSLNGPPTVCAWCKRLRNEKGWTSLKVSIERHPDILFTHGICPECFGKCTAELETLDSRTAR